MPSSLVLHAAAAPLVAVVVVDQEARDEGYAIALEDLVVGDALPVDVAEGEHVAVVAPDGERHPLDVAPGEAWEISGAAGEAWMSRLGEEVRTDVIVVRGEEQAIRALADALGAEVRGDGDRTWLVGEDILFDAPWVDPEGIGELREVKLVRVDEPIPADRPSRLAAPIAAPVAVAAPTAAPVAAPSGTPLDAVATTLPTRAKVACPDRKAPPPPPPAAPPEPAAPSEPAGTQSPELDPMPYARMYLCGDGTPILLDPGGSFVHAEVAGEWYVSAPGVVHLLVGGGLWGRAAIEADRHYCRAVW